MRREVREIADHPGKTCCARACRDLVSGGICRDRNGGCGRRRIAERPFRVAEELVVCSEHLGHVDAGRRGLGRRCVHPEVQRALTRKPHDCVADAIRCVPPVAEEKRDSNMCALIERVRPRFCVQIHGREDACARSEGLRASRIAGPHGRRPRYLCAVSIVDGPRCEERPALIAPDIHHGPAIPPVWGQRESQGDECGTISF